MATLPDPVELTRDLIRCPSVTPAEGGALALLEGLLTAHGFVCRRIDVEGIANLYARWGTAAPNFCFAGHTDVVPIGERAAWTADPFGAEIRDGEVMGRGATDMKSGVAAFAAAACKFVTETPPDGSVSL
ncbi:MAG: M20/M25/M40 family metallo-hydrolase, partial [Pseudomonadota bacterium]